MSRSGIPVETLIAQLHSRDWTTRCDAARLLGQSRDPRAVEALLPDLNDADWRVRRNAAQALGALRDKRATRPLVRSLGDRVMTVRQRALVALGRIKDPQALPALLKTLLEDQRTSYEASKAIAKFGKKALPQVVKAYEQSNHPRLMLLLIELRYEGALELVLKLLESRESATRLAAIRELGTLGNQKAVPALIEQLRDSEPAIQSEAVRALGKLEARETIPDLLSLLVDDDLYGPRASLYHAVTEAFQAFGGVTREIQNAFPGNYPEIFNLGGAPLSLPEALALSRRDQPGILDEAFSRFQSGSPQPIEVPGLPAEVSRKVLEDIAWRFGVMFADAKDARQERLKCLVGLLRSPSSLERSAAALTLPWYADDLAVEPLVQAAQDPDETVRAAATWALRALQKMLLHRRQLGS